MKRKYFVWTLPTVFIGLLTLIVLTLQSCSVPLHVNAEGTFINIKDIRNPMLVYGVVLFIGTLSSAYMWFQISKISRRLKDLGYPI